MRKTYLIKGQGLLKVKGNAGELFRMDHKKEDSQTKSMVGRGLRTLRKSLWYASYARYSE